jgi:thiol-disulfide isomerase/thioredoxin
VGCALAAALGVGLFTSGGSNGKFGPPHVGGQAPRFSLPRVNGVGTVGNQIGDGSPTVILFFANWCSICHAETPALAKVVRAQARPGSSLYKIQVVGVDPLDSAGNAEAFVKGSGVTFPVGLDSDASVMGSQYILRGPPYAIFIGSDGKIMAIKASTLTPSEFLSAERQLVADPPRESA